MTSDREKCSITSLLPMSCRGRAEAFARRLHTRLSSLGTHNDDIANETSWLQNHESSIAVSQPRHSSDSSADIFFDFGEAESPSSPDEELERSELERLLNRDNLKLSHSEDCHCSIAKEKLKPLANGYKGSSNDSDSSEGVFYDTTENLDVKKVNGVDSKCDNGDIDELDEFCTTSDNTVPLESVEDFSSLSLSDSSSIASESCSLHQNGTKVNGSELKLILVNGDDPAHVTNGTEDAEEETSTSSTTSLSNSSPETNGRLPEPEDCTETYTSKLNITKELTIECPNSHNVKNGAIQTTDEFDEEDDRLPRIRRCSSLKTGKTPPGTPGRKKIVRFADVLGLDLADVRTFLDDIPKIPTSAYNDLKDADINDEVDGLALDPHLKFHGIKTDKVLVPLFQQPGSLPDFLDKVRDRSVCLENAILEDPIAFCVKGTVRVRNLDFNKSVHIRYSLDQWRSFADVQAAYVDNSCDGFSDKFTFIIYAHTLGVGQRLEFAARFQCKGCQYWDNNNGINYVFQCLPSSHNTTFTPITGADVDSWGASFYYKEDQTICNKQSSIDTDDDPLTYTAVQEFITHTLGQKQLQQQEQQKQKQQKQQQTQENKNNNISTVFVILIFSFLIMFLQRSIYFTK